jgi:hypothetical protein
MKTSGLGGIGIPHASTAGAAALGAAEDVAPVGIAACFTAGTSNPGESVFIIEEVATPLLYYQIAYAI